MSISPKHSVHHGPPLTSISILDPFVGRYEIKASNCVRYLGVFIDRYLTWKDHMAILATWVRSTVWSLQILGNSIRGISLVKWRKLFHAIILPILTYAAPVWWHRSGQKSLANTLQIAQNDAIW